MSLLTFNNLSQQYAGYDVFVGLNGQIETDSKIGLVGRNGIGKTTILQTLAGIEQPFEGDISMADSTRIGYLRQEAVLAFADTGNTLYNEMLTVFDRVFEWQDAMRAIEERMGDGSASEADYDVYDEYLTNVELYGGYDYESRIEKTLVGLGFNEQDWQLPLNILSGGQKTRALLAKLLLELPDLLILDEPTNHLDIEAIRWLEGMLSVYRGALLIVSHDRYFLNKVVNRIWEMFPMQIEDYRGNYNAYLDQREHRRERTQQEWDSMMERFMNDFAYIKKNTLDDPNAKGRFKRLTREVEAVQSHGIAAVRYIKRHGWAQFTNHFERSNPPQTVAQLDRALRDLKSPITHDRSMRLKLEAEDRSGDVVLRGRNLQIGYERETPLFKSEDFELLRGEIAALIGQNGTGKSTFLKTIMDEMKPLKGHLTFGAALQVGYFAQAHDALDHSNTVIEELMRHKNDMGIAAARHYLAPYLFKGEDVFKPVSALSGGERGRLALAILSLQGANLLLLDEPTNHLDIPSQEVLQQVLEDYDGTVILVTHDRYLVDAIATQIWDLREGDMQVFKGNYQEYLEKIAVERADTEQSTRTKKKAEPEQPAVDPKAISKIEAQITALEGEIGELETLLAHASVGGDGETIQALSKQYSAQKKRLAELVVDWEDLMEKATA